MEDSSHDPFCFSNPVHRQHHSAQSLDPLAALLLGNRQMVTSKRGTASPRTPLFLQGRRDTTTRGIHKSRNLNPPPLREAELLGNVPIPAIVAPWPISGPRLDGPHTHFFNDSRSSATSRTRRLYSARPLIAPVLSKDFDVRQHSPANLSSTCGSAGIVEEVCMPFVQAVQNHEDGKLTFWFSYSNGLDAGLRLHRRKYLELMLLQSQAFSHQRLASFGKEGEGPRFNTL